MTTPTLWMLILVAMFLDGIIETAITGDVRWLALCVVPALVIRGWWRT